MKWKPLKDLTRIEGGLSGEELRQISACNDLEGAKALLKALALSVESDERERDDRAEVNGVVIRKDIRHILGRIDKAQQVLSWPNEAKALIEKQDTEDQR